MFGIDHRLVRFGAIVLLVLASATATFSQLKPPTPDEAVKAVADLEAKLREPQHPIRRFGVLLFLPSAWLAAGDTEKAEKYAKQLQPLAAEIDASTGLDLSSLSNAATHNSNIILGLIEFQKGNTSEAKEHLLAAGRIRGITPPYLASFGPNMLLAKKLIEAGERDAVLEYLDMCAGFWKLEDGRIAKWKKQVSSGIVPDFGANNLYVAQVWPRSR